MTGCELKCRWREGGYSAGYTSVSSDPNVAVVAGRAGFDWVLIDEEHTPRNPETVAAIIQAAKRTPACPLVRVHQNDPDVIGQYLDMGAEGVMVPLIRSAEEARRAVRSCRYPPAGVRSYGPLVASDFGRNEDYFARANEETVVILQPELIEFVQQVEPILAVEGIDALFIGTMDLSLSMNLFEQWDHPDFIAAVRRVAQAAQGRGIPVGVPVQGLGGLQKSLAWLREHELPVQLLGFGSDLGLIQRGAEAMLQAVFSTLGSKQSG